MSGVNRAVIIPQKQSFLEKIAFTSTPLSVLKMHGLACANMAAG
jgi:hypothetical protein